MRKGLLACAGMLITACAASAADDEAMLLDAPEVEVSEQTQQGWYFRADLGYAPWIDGGTPSTTAGGGASTDFDEARFAKPLAGGIGMGYRLSEIFRTDLTAEISRGDLDGSSIEAAPCAPTEAAGTACRHEFASQYWSAGLMANVYADVGTIMNFTPYVGAGLGATYMQWDDVTDRARCVAGGQACLQDDYGTIQSPGSGSWRFTYALMAGASYDLTDRVKLDVGYRFTQMDGGAMFGSGSDDGLQRHEFRVGLRAAIW